MVDIKTLHFFPVQLGAAGYTSDCAHILFDTFAVASLSNFSKVRGKVSTFFLYFFPKSEKNRENQNNLCLTQGFYSICIKRYCGAVAVSYYSSIKQNGTESNPFTVNAIKKLVSVGCVTNVHYVLSRQSIQEAIYRLKNNIFPEGINAVIFLLYKPVGQANKDKMLTIHDPVYIQFLQELDAVEHPFKIGFDSCQSPAIRAFCPSVAKASLEFCEAARFSMYIDCELNAFPCSFGHELSKYAIDLSTRSIIEAWNSAEFDFFRELQVKACNGCEIYDCRNCALGLGINMCENSFLLNR